MAQELEAFDVGLGRYSEDGSPCIVKFEYTTGYALQGSDPWSMLEEVTDKALHANEHDTERQKELARSKPYVVFGIQPIGAVSWYYPQQFVQLSKKITKVLKFPEVSYG